MPGELKKLTEVVLLHSESQAHRSANLLQNMPDNWNVQSATIKQYQKMPLAIPIAGPTATETVLLQIHKALLETIAHHSLGKTPGSEVSRKEGQLGSEISIVLASSSQSHKFAQYQSLPASRRVARFPGQIEEWIATLPVCLPAKFALGVKAKLQIQER